jgi:hypothetical protein
VPVAERTHHHDERRTFPGQDHGVADDIIAPVLVEFLSAG